MKQFLGRYGFFIGLAFVIGLAWYITPEEVPPETWHEDDKRAFGGFILHEFLADYTSEEVTSVYQPINEYFAEEEDFAANLVLVSDYLELSRQDWYRLESMIEAGSTVIMATKDASFFLRHYLNANMNTYNFYGPLDEILESRESLQFEKELNFPEEPIEVPEKAASNYFVEADLDADSVLVPQVLARNQDLDPVLLRHKIGKGQLIFSSMPSLLNNYFLMDAASREFSQGIFSFLKPNTPVYHFEFYHLGRLESRSPLRATLKEPALRNAVYILAFLALIYILLGGKRRQKAVPEKVVWYNDNLDFLEKLSFLYHRNGHHRNLLQKRMQFFQEFLEQNYRIRLRPNQPEVFEEIIRKLEPQAQLMGTIRKAYEKLYQSKQSISANELLRTEQALHEFYQTYRHGRKH